MGNSIMYFMWPYQQHFRVVMEHRAEELFRKLDDRLRARVFLVGVLAANNTARFPSCVEPGDDFWIHSDNFRSVKEISKRLVSQYRESNIRQSHPIAQKSQDHALELRSIQDAIRQVIEAHQSRPENRRFYVSDPERVDEYWVCLVLSLQNDIVASYPALRSSSAQVHEYRSLPLPVSLLEAVAEQFLRHAAGELRKTEPCLPEPTDSDELLRGAGAAMARSVVPRMSDKLNGHGYNLFRHCSAISSQRYERSAGSGRIVLAAEDHPAVDRAVVFESPVDLKDYRAARKLLQLSFDKIVLHSDSDRICGLAEVGVYDGSKENLFEVNIVGHHQWELRHEDHCLMTVRDGIPALPKFQFKEAAFRSNVTRIFSGISGSATDLLWKLVQEAEQESHGTMLLICTAAAEEAKRLAPQGTTIAPCQLTPKLLKHLTPIDGAILIDPDCTCHAIGTILDGKSTAAGDPGRGARFNSAVRYVESFPDKVPCLAVVVSEDGGVDFVPNLHAPIKRSTIDRTIAELESYKSEDQLRIRRYRDILDWLDEHRLYLTEADCDLLNRLVAELEAKFRRESESHVWNIRPRFEPDPKMDEALYYEDEQ
ncbi:MAG: diadenylate cyclase [Bryobacterales bacterium]|nr:diadenylate cyclase [Bryobacterales bacterium]